MLDISLFIVQLVFSILRAAVGMVVHLIAEWSLTSSFEGIRRFRRLHGNRHRRQGSSPDASSGSEPVRVSSDPVDPSPPSTAIHHSPRPRPQDGSPADGRASSSAGRQGTLSVPVFGALVLLAAGLFAAGLLSGGWAIRSHREEVMMRTMPSVLATVSEVQEHENSTTAWIAFTRVSDGAVIACRSWILLHGEHRGLLVGSAVSVVPRSDSCGEPAIVGERDTTFLAVLSGLALLVSVVLGILAARGTRPSPYGRGGGRPAGASTP